MSLPGIRWADVVGTSDIQESEREHPKPKVKRSACVRRHSARRGQEPEQEERIARSSSLRNAPGSRVHDCAGLSSAGCRRDSRVASGVTHGVGMPSASHHRNSRAIGPGNHGMCMSSLRFLGNLESAHLPAWMAMTTQTPWWRGHRPESTGSRRRRSSTRRRSMLSWAREPIKVRISSCWVGRRGGPRCALGVLARYPRRVRRDPEHGEA